MMTNSKRFGYGLAVVLSNALLSANAASGEDAVNLMNRTPTQQEIIDALTPPKLTRGIRPVGQEETPPPAVDLLVQFELNSSELTDQTKTTLSTLAAALQSDKLKTFRFMVEGHTDGRGTDEYNMLLSERRAASVVNYLVTQHGIRPEQLSSVGKGERELLDTSDPNSAANRRVRIRNLNAS